MNIRYLAILFFTLFLSNNLIADEGEAWFIENKGQWADNIAFKVELAKGSFFIEKDRFTYFLHNFAEVYNNTHNHSHGQEHDESEPHSHDHEHDKVKCHAVFGKFNNSSWKGDFAANDTSSFYKNYFIGNDSTKWASNVRGFKKLRLKEYYNGIDLVLEANESGIKYSFDAKAGAAIEKIEIEYEGADSLVLDNDDLLIYTRFGPIKETDLFVYNLTDNERKKKVKANFNVENDIVRFQLPEGYDTTKRFVIDPQLTFSTFTGSTSDNWGFTACPDKDANTFGGGIVMGNGYPTTAGAYDDSYNGGEGNTGFDIGISKFNQQGNTLLYSTYIGGNRNETPNSIIADEDGNLYVLGVTSSIDFPVTTGAPQTVFQGGPTVSPNNLQFSGTDIVVFKLSPNGDNLLGSTFHGGSRNDGLNLQTLNYNYGDQFRGEIVLDEADNVYITSTTQSNDFPIVNGFNTSLSGQQDAIVSKFNNNITNVIWSTYLGGSSNDCGNSLQVGPNGNLYVAGGTNSSSLSFSSGNAITYNGGLADGFVAQLDPITSTPITGTFVGTQAYDQVYFVQVDLNNDVYVFGQTAGNMAVSQNVYSNPNSGQFIRKYDESLNTIEWTTRVGGGSGDIEISPTAFLVSDCDEIYYAGWGGQTNQSSMATNSSTDNFPTTSNAFQTNTNGNNFYVAVLGNDATSLNYASFMGGISSSANHVDGGTSRFDKKGRIYHSVCGSCGPNSNGFTTTPGVYSETSESSNCNMAVFKFDLGIIESSVSTPEPFICIPDPVEFDNNSENANEFFWDFGDGNTSTDSIPTHVYDTPGTYTVTLVASDTNGCYEADSSIVEITIADFQGSVNQPTDPICSGDSIQLEASGGNSYAWYPAEFLNDSTIANPTATVTETTTFTVIIEDTCGTDSLDVVVEVIGAEADIIDDLQICLDDTVAIWADGGVSYSWNDHPSIIGDLNNPVIEIVPQETTEYFVTIITQDGCELTLSVLVEVFNDVPNPILADSLSTCLGDEVTVTAGGAVSYEWFPDENISSTTDPTVTIDVTESATYFVSFTNPCGTEVDSVFIEVIEVLPEAGNDTIICPGETAFLWANGGISYSWSPTLGVANPNSSSTAVTPQSSTNYTVTVTDEFGCTDSASVSINLFPAPIVSTIPDQYPFEGDELEISAQASTNGTFSWSPEDGLSCTECSSTSLIAEENMEYFVHFVDENGCEAMDDIKIILEGILYVPNTFTPDGDGHNDFFYPKGGNIDEFHMIVFNRWGEVMFESFNFDGQWDGTYGGKPCKDGTYVWKITYTDISNNKKEVVGHVNLLR